MRRFSITFYLPGAFPLWACVEGYDEDTYACKGDWIDSCELYTHIKCNIDSLIHDDWSMLHAEARDIIRARTLDALAERITTRVSA